MASNLLKDGYNLYVYNCTHARAAVFAGQGAKVVRHPAQTAEPGGIVMTSLANDHAVERIVLDDQGLLDRLGPNGIHVSMSTISPALLDVSQTITNGTKSVTSLRRSSDALRLRRPANSGSFYLVRVGQKTGFVPSWQRWDRGSLTLERPHGPRTQRDMYTKHH